MKKILIYWCVITLTAALLSSLAMAQMVTKQEAQSVAENWIDFVAKRQGNWHGSQSAFIEDIFRFEIDDRLLGYFCDIHPSGFIVISPRKELGAVKAYSTASNLDPYTDDGMASLIRQKLININTFIQDQVGSIESVSTPELESILEFSYRQDWDAFLHGIDINYQEADTLVDAHWHQRPPYNDQCPNMGCTWPPCYYNTNALVGCVATAGAQIMHFWKWPPYGYGSPYSDTYNWINMPNGFTGCTWNINQVNAVAELCHEIGVAVGMNYGCGGSSVPTEDMEAVYENNYRYSAACHREDREDYSATDWFNRIKAQLNVNRPIHYRVTGHSILCDGWDEIVSSKYYHMNYGWNDSYTAWYLLDNLHLGHINEEYILEDICPVTFFGSAFTGTYACGAFPYRYFDQDTWGWNATIQAGNKIQFLPNVVVHCSGSTGTSIKFQSTSTNESRFFARGDESIGVLMEGATFKMSPGANFVIY